jgi:enoyl-[acyl-carrier protein] reductase/trans-2-enoyl-CoA reductase (NAD+)
MKAGVLAENVKTVAFSYIGPEFTLPIYNKGSIGKAKEDLQLTADRLNKNLAPLHGHAYISVNKGLVTQASSAIPVVPLYMSLLYKVMKAKHLHEGCIEQMWRLFHDYLSAPQLKGLDNAGRIRLDDWEMRDDVQQEVAQLWQDVSNDNLLELSDLEGYREEFYRLFGFGMAGIDYDADVDIMVSIPSIETESITE